MSVKLASDDDSPEFLGASNPDSRLAVQFYKKLVINEFKSEQAQRPIHEERDFIKIFVPGDSTSVIDTFVREEHKQRFPIHWARYKNASGSDQVVGTPLSAWSLLSSSVAEDLKHYKFFTVEQIANSSDAQISALGMAAGMAPFSLRERAQNFLKHAAGLAETTHREDELKALKEQNAQLKAMMEQMQEQMAALSEKRKPGRPPKEADAA